MSIDRSLTNSRNKGVDESKGRLSAMSAKRVLTQALWPGIRPRMNL